MRPTVLLFDIDGTLLDASGAGRRAIERAFERHAQDANACSSFSFDGMTDRAIVRRGLAAAGRPCTDAAIDALLADYVTHLSLALDELPCRVHEGVERALDAAQAGGAAIGLGTGNIRAGAEAKLGRAGLTQRFSFGGFGCDHEERNELVRIGAQRGAAHLSRPLEDCRVIVIGDTPKDVAAARAIGALCLGVGTGAFGPAALLEAGATWAYDDLAAPGALESLLGGAPNEAV